MTADTQKSLPGCICLPGRALKGRGQAKKILVHKGPTTMGELRSGLREFDPLTFSNQSDAVKHFMEHENTLLRVNNQTHNPSRHSTGERNTVYGSGRVPHR